MTYQQYIRENIPARSEIDVFLHELSGAKFDQDTGHILGKAADFKGYLDNF